MAANQRTWDKLYAAAKAVEESTQARNQAILEVAEEGETFRAIGEVAGLSHTGVAIILDKLGWSSPHGRGRRPAQPVQAPKAKRTTKASSKASKRAGKSAAKAGTSKRAKLSPEARERANANARARRAARKAASKAKA